jgi:hypothetical protein
MKETFSYICVNYFLGVFAKLQKAALSFVMFIRMERLGSHQTGVYHI